MGGGGGKLGRGGGGGGRETGDGSSEIMAKAASRFSSSFQHRQLKAQQHFSRDTLKYAYGSFLLTATTWLAGFQRQ